MFDYELVYADAEFSQPEGSGDPPTPICFVARSSSGSEWKLWDHDMWTPEPPFNVGPDALFICYNAVAELSIFAVLGWPFPKKILDLYIAFRAVTNEFEKMPSLLKALRYYGLPSTSTKVKDNMQDRAIEGFPFSSDERELMLEYCREDVLSLEYLLPEIVKEADFNLQQVLMWSEFMKPVAMAEHNGVPVDAAEYSWLWRRRDALLDRMITELDREFGCFDGRVFKRDRFLDYLDRNQISWAYTRTGAPVLREDFLRSISGRYPQINDLRELFSFREQMKGDFALPIGQDGRNRFPYMPFATKTSRAAPKAKKSVFSKGTWTRGFIKPSPGKGLAYLDYRQQEFGIAAALSGDPEMIKAYQSGDVYAEMGRSLGTIPPGGTKATHPLQRQTAKALALGSLYGKGPYSLAIDIGKSVGEAKQIMAAHKKVYHQYWSWIENIVDIGLLEKELETLLGWKYRIARVRVMDEKTGREKSVKNSLLNFPMQSNGAEMMRTAAVLVYYAGIKIVALVHDAIMIEADLEDLNRAALHTEHCMVKAARALLTGTDLPTIGVDREFVRTGRYMDDRGLPFWEKLWTVAGEVFEDAPVEVQGAPQQDTIVSSTGHRVGAIRL